MTTHETWSMAQQLGVRMPITEHLHQLLTGASPLQATVSSLLARHIKDERL